MEEQLGERISDYSSIVGEHFLRGEDWEHAYGYLNRAGEAAIRLYAHAEARTHFNNSLKALDHLEDSEKNVRRRIDTIIRLTVSSWLTDPAEVLLERLNQAERLIASVSDSEDRTPEDALRLARVQFWIGRAYYQRGDMREALGYYKQVLPVAQQAADEELMVIPTGAIGQALIVQGHLAKGCAMLGQAIPVFEKMARWPQWIQAKSFYGAGFAGMGDWQQGLSEAQDALAKSNEFKSFTGIGVSQNCIGYAYLFGGELQRAMEAAQAAVKAAEQSKDLIYLYVGYALWAWSAGRIGQMDIASKKMAKSQQVAQKLGGKVIMGDVALAAQSEIALFKGDWQNAIALSKKTLEVAQMTGAVWSAGVAYRVWGQALVKLDHRACRKPRSILRKASVFWKPRPAEISWKPPERTWPGALCAGTAAILPRRTPTGRKPTASLRKAMPRRRYRRFRSSWQRDEGSGKLEVGSRNAEVGKIEDERMRR